MIHLYPDQDRQEIIKRITVTNNTPGRIWQPQPRQMDLLRACGLDEALHGGEVKKAITRVIGYGGAVYGGKTEGGIGAALIAAMGIPGVRIGFFRRMFTELEGADGPIDRSRHLFPGAGATYSANKHVWTFENGSEIHFCHCKNEGDRFNYQSQAFDILIIDEATHFPWIIMDYLFTRNRPSKENQLAGTGKFEPFVLLMSNPGNVGHMWYMKLFDTINKQGDHEQIKLVINMNGQEDITFFIPAYLKDNPIGLQKDPNYEDSLRRRDPGMADALIKGDWTQFAGQVLEEFDYNKHTVDDFIVPFSWIRKTSMDWGYDAPWAVLFWAKNQETMEWYIYRMIYKRLIPDPPQAMMMRDHMQEQEQFLYHFSDPSVWTKRSIDTIARSTADVYQDHGIMLTPADNNSRNKIAKAHAAMAMMPNGLYPVRFFRNACKIAIELLPTIVYDDKDTNRIADGQEDHIWDAWTYGLTDWSPPALAYYRKKPQAAGRLDGVKGI